MGGRESSETMTDAERTISDATDSSRLIMAVRICNSALLVHAPRELGWSVVGAVGWTIFKTTTF